MIKKYLIYLDLLLEDLRDINGAICETKEVSQRWDYLTNELRSAFGFAEGKRGRVDDIILFKLFEIVNFF